MRRPSQISRDTSPSPQRISIVTTSSANALLATTLVRGVVREVVERQHPITVGAELLRVRIAAEIDDPCAIMQELVIADVLADHEIAISVVPFVAVDVVDLRATRQEVAQCSLSNQDVLIHAPGR
jgi:hypothetical protein